MVDSDCAKIAIVIKKGSSRLKIINQHELDFKIRLCFGKTEDGLVVSAPTKNISQPTKHSGILGKNQTIFQRTLFPCVKSPIRSLFPLLIWACHSCPFAARTKNMYGYTWFPIVNPTGSWRAVIASPSTINIIDHYNHWILLQAIIWLVDISHPKI